MKLTLRLFEKVLDDARTGIPLRRALKNRDVHSQDFYRLIAKDVAACERYARAKMQGCHAFADETLEIVDETPPQVMTQFGSHVDGAWVQWQKNRVELRRWQLSKLMPKTYGDKIELDTGNVPITVEIHEEKA